jgi:hypothetical protein
MLARALVAVSAALLLHGMSLPLDFADSSRIFGI